MNYSISEPDQYIFAKRIHTSILDSTTRQGQPKPPVLLVVSGHPVGVPSYLQQAHQPHPLLKHGEIIYDLLWALFKPNEMVRPPSNLQISKFAGVRQITKFPLAYHPRRLAVETKLVSGFHMMKNGPFQVQFDKSHHGGCRNLPKNETQTTLGPKLMQPAR